MSQPKLNQLVSNLHHMCLMAGFNPQTNRVKGQGYKT